MGFEVVTLWEAYRPDIEQRLDDDVWIVEQAEAGRILLTRDRLRLPRHAADRLGDHQHPPDHSAISKRGPLH